MTKLVLIRQTIVWLLPVCIGSWGVTLLIGPACLRPIYTLPPLLVDPVTAGPEAAALGLVPLTPDEQLDLALATVAFLESWQPPDAAAAQLAQVMLPHTAAPLYNERELAHLLDVKQRTDFIRHLAWLTTIPVLGGLLFLLRRPETRPVAYAALRRGGAKGEALVFCLGLILVTLWPFFFYQFHGLFFPPGSWSFAPTDSLMRLFPESFFMAWALVLVGMIWITGVLLALLGLLLGKLAANQNAAEGGSRVANVVH